MHVLIIDNNAFVARGYMAMLKRAGHVVSFEEGGENAIERMRELKPDMLLLDLNMPGKDGFSILEERWQDPSLRSIPVLVVSSLERGDLEERLHTLHADGYIHKLDVDPHSLLESIQKLIPQS